MQVAVTVTVTVTVTCRPNVWYCTDREAPLIGPF